MLCLGTNGQPKLLACSLRWKTQKLSQLEKDSFRKKNPSVLLLVGINSETKILWEFYLLKQRIPPFLLDPGDRPNRRESFLAWQRIALFSLTNRFGMLF